MVDATMEMMRDLDSFVEEALPELDPIIAHDITEYGWRGLTQQGEVYEVKGNNGHAIEVPPEIIVAHRGRPIGRRKIGNDETINIDSYLAHFNRVVALYKGNRIEEALIEADETLKVAPTLRAKFNRAMVLLAAGRWREGFYEYWQCEQLAPFMRPQVSMALERGLQPWQGEDLRGKRLLLLHAHGFGDTIQMLRYLHELRAMGAHVIMDMPPALERLAGRCGIVSEIADPDYFCPILHLLHWLKVTPENVDGRPYLVAAKPQAWSRCEQLGRLEGTPAPRRRIGIAWSIGKPSDGDYPREIPLSQLVANLTDPSVELYSVQTQGADEARALGVHVREFTDFADCAAFMMQMDKIISVDTAALHLAGAIGHPCVFGLLSYWASWRWLARWYENVTLCRQIAPDDWEKRVCANSRGLNSASSRSRDRLPLSNAHETGSYSRWSVAPQIGCNYGITAKRLLENVPTLEKYIGIDVPFGHRSTLPCQQTETPVNAGSGRQFSDYVGTVDGELAVHLAVSSMNKGRSKVARQERRQHRRRRWLWRALSSVPRVSILRPEGSQRLTVAIRLASARRASAPINAKTIPTQLKLLRGNPGKDQAAPRWTMTRMDRRGYRLFRKWEEESERWCM